MILERGTKLLRKCRIRMVHTADFPPIFWKVYIRKHLKYNLCTSISRIRMLKISWLDGSIGRAAVWSPEDVISLSTITICTKWHSIAPTDDH